MRHLYARLETKEGEEFYRLAKQRDGAGKDVQHAGAHPAPQKGC